MIKAAFPNNNVKPPPTNPPKPPLNNPPPVNKPLRPFFDFDKSLRELLSAFAISKVETKDSLIDFKLFFNIFAFFLLPKNSTKFIANF